MQIWKKTIGLANQHPLAGWGMGTFKHIFNAYMPTYRSAHNLWVQVLFEFGYPGLIFVLFTTGFLAIRLIKRNALTCLSGLAILIGSSLLHFPERQIQVVLIIIAFLAYCERSIKTHGRPNPS
jgi:O-antigen ligase